MDHPLLLPDSATNSQHVTSGLTPHSLSDTQDTLTSVSSNFDSSAIGSVMPSAHGNEINIVGGEEVEEVKVSFNVGGEEDRSEVGERKLDDINTGDDKVEVSIEDPKPKVGDAFESHVVEDNNVATVFQAEDVPLPLETSSEDDAPSPEATKRAFESIMETSEISSLRKPTSELNPSSFDDFAELLANPEKLQEQEQEQERKLQDREEAEADDVPGIGAGDHSSPAISSDASHSTSSVPDVLKSTSTKNPPIDADAGDSDMDTQWPDIGVPEPTRDTAVHLRSNLAEAVSVKGAVSNEVCQVVPDSELLMPFALTGMHEFQVQDEVEKLNVAPDLLHQEVEGEGALEAEEGTLKTKSRSRKRSKRGKKQTATSLGVTEFMEAPRYVRT